MEDEREREDGEIQEPVARSLTIPEQRNRTLGYMLGFTSLSAPICCALYYVTELNMPAWVHVFAIIVNLAIVGCGALFLGSNDLESDQKIKMGSSGVKIMASVWGVFICNFSIGDCSYSPLLIATDTCTALIYFSMFVETGILRLSVNSTI